MSPRCDIPIELLREYLSYSPETGDLTWIKETGGQFGLPGRRAGYKRKDGYIEVMLKGNSILGHRAAWAITYNVWPSRDIDHFDGIRSNNRITNLREATRGQNCGNVERRGVYQRGNRFIAKINPSGRQIHLGVFRSYEEGRAAYLAATKKYFGEFSVTERPSGKVNPS